MLSGRVGDIYGHKKLFITGVLLFSLASLIGGLAPSDIVLILARVVQGLGAAMASATGISILVAASAEGKETVANKQSNNPFAVSYLTLVYIEYAVIFGIPSGAAALVIYYYRYK